MKETMKLNYSPRQSGKTTNLIERMVQDDRYVFLTFSSREACRLRQKYCKYVDPARIMYWREYVQKKKGIGHNQKVLVDNADMVLEDAIGDYVYEISMTAPSDPTKILRGKFI